MKRFLYVVAYIPAGSEDPKEVAFVHEFIRASDADEAYGIGMETLDDRVLTLGALLNNYVVELP